MQAVLQMILLRFVILGNLPWKQPIAYSRAADAGDARLANRPRTNVQLMLCRC